MAHVTKKRVGVLRGGPSSEYAVSLKTGAHVLRNLNTERYIPVDIFIDKQGAWHVHGVASTPEKILRNVDVVFNALHGEYGEDGKVVRLLELFSVPYTGSALFPAVMAQHKGHAKKHLQKHGVKTPVFKIVKRDELTLERVRDLFFTMPHPAIVKPMTLGSSVGISIAKTFTELRDALMHASAFAEQILIEEFIVGREATCGVVADFRGETLYTLFPSEIVQTEGELFLSYDGKYNKKARHVHPGRFSALEKETIQTLAKKVHETLGLRHYSRSDFILSPKRGIYFLEANSLPGLYASAPYTEALAGVGVSIGDFLDHVLGLALSKK